MGTSNDLTLTIGVLAQLMQYLRYKNVDVDKFLYSIGVDPAIFEVPDSRISIETYLKIEYAAAAESGDPYFGLHMGEHHEAGNWSILGYLMMNCQTLAQAMIKAGKYYKIISTLIQTSVYPKGRNFVIVFAAQKHSPELSRHCFEAALSSTVQMIRKLSSQKIDPVEAGFAFPPPPALDEYLRFFRSPVLFGQKSCYITFPMSILNLPVVCPNAALLSYFESYVQNYLDALENDGPCTTEVIKRVIPRLDGGNLSIHLIAKEMLISARTLQNRLKDEGASFRLILEDTRLKLAKRYLGEGRTVEDITYLLGFKDVSVFRKSFKEWTGQTLGEYRRFPVIMSGQSPGIKNRAL